MTATQTQAGPGRLAINRLQSTRPLDAAAVERFLEGRDAPLVEGLWCTFLWRGEADEAWICQRIVGLPDRIPLRRLGGTELWYLPLELPEGSRVEYQIEVRRGEQYERFNDPLNERLSHSPMGSSSVCFGAGYETPDWVLPDPEARQGDLE
jgi:enterochelin esterase family protein